MNTIKVRAYCNGAVFEAEVKPTVRALKALRADVLAALSVDFDEPARFPVLISIPGGKQ